MTEAAERKKTDEPTEDDAAVTGKASLSEVNDEERESDKEEEDAEKNSNPDSEEDNEAVDEVVLTLFHV